MEIERPIALESHFERRANTLRGALPAQVNCRLELPKPSHSFHLKFSNPPRPGKKCLVLDVDLTLCKCVGHDLTERPFLHEFLAKAYQDYDLVIWSATSKARLKWKLNRMGVLGHGGYKITALLTKRAMGLLHCKPLRLIWDKCPEFYTRKNTIIVDDQKRNFQLNPQNGLPIPEFKPEEYDYELQELADYLAYVALEDDLSQFDHQRWKDYW